jgi:hypothetical protein
VERKCIQDIHAVGPSDPQTQTMEVPSSSKTLATQRTATWCKNPKRVLTLRVYHHENLKKSVIKLVTTRNVLNTLIGLTMPGAPHPCSLGRNVKTNVI